ncbi:hypothetical protein BGY98DRAFT_1099244 [Russula aff. rugulosa BPL654]|nr:hypothetical protein BGY98DRAFT_1099244 [Russula aff. rugulosa BPL654]
MTTAHSVHTTDVYGAQSPSSSRLPASRDSLADPDEISPLLGTNRADTIQSSQSERRHSARSSFSAFLDKNAGLCLIASSQIFFSAMIICVKWLNNLDEPVPILELLWVGMTITYIGSVAYMLWRKIPDPLLGPKEVRGLLSFQFHWVAGLYLSLEHLSVSDATMLTFITPILLGFTGTIILKEPLSLREMLSGLCSFIGVILIARPQFLFGDLKGDPSEVVMPRERMQSVTMGLVGVLGTTTAYTLLRAIGKRAHTLHSLVFYSSSCVMGSTAGMIIFKISPVIPTHALWLAMLLLIGIFGLTSQTLLVMGFQRETASRGALAIYTSIVFAVVLEFIVFRTTPSALSIAGATVIISSATYTSLTKKPSSNQPLDRPVIGHFLPILAIRKIRSHDHPASPAKETPSSWIASVSASKVWPP